MHIIMNCFIMVQLFMIFHVSLNVLKLLLDQHIGLVTVWIYFWLMHQVLLIVLLILDLETLIILLSHLLFKLVFCIPSITFSCQVYLKSSVDWSRVCQDLQESTWGDVYNSPNSVNALFLEEFQPRL